MYYQKAQTLIGSCGGYLSTVISNVKGCLILIDRLRRHETNRTHRRSAARLQRSYNVLVVRTSRAQ